MSENNRWLEITAAMLVLFIVVNLISFVWFPFLPWFEEREAGQEVIEQTYDAENAIQQYEEFRRLYNEIQAQREAVNNSYQELERFYDVQGEDPDEWSRTAEERHNRIQQRITGNQNQLENLIADYNSQSQQANSELFKCHLPYQVDERFGISGPPGSGDADEPVDTGPDGEPIDPDANIPEPEQCDGLPDEIQQGGN